MHRAAFPVPEESMQSVCRGMADGGKRKWATRPRQEAMSHKKGSVRLPTMVRLCGNSPRKSTSPKYETLSMSREEGYG
jgi:hypothetical protein